MQDNLKGSCDECIYGQLVGRVRRKESISYTYVAILILVDFAQLLFLPRRQIFIKPWRGWAALPWRRAVPGGRASLLVVSVLATTVILATTVTGSGIGRITGVGWGSTIVWWRRITYGSSLDD